MSEDLDQRRFTRVPVDLDVQISHHGEMVHGSIINCSLTGMFVRTSSKLEIGEQIEVKIPIPGAGPLQALSRVVWTDWREKTQSGGFGVHFVPLSDDQVAYLRSFLYE